jgi:ELWxxDGT repeat protein
MVTLNGTLFFRANDGVHGWELWKSDCTEAGTVLVKDIFDGPNGSSPHNLVASSGPDGDWVYFNASDGVHGSELWRSDGTAAGTAMVIDIHPTGAGDPDGLLVIDGTLYFAADDGTNGTELWTSDGTAAGTTLVMDINPGPSGSSPHNLTVVGDMLYFAANDGTHGKELWAMDIRPAHNIFLPLVIKNG